MEIRYQFFVSSTFTDLQEERQTAIKSILQLDHFPAGMELFPASDDEAWDLIRGIIDASDYYVLIIGGRYGSAGADGLSFTEKEYDYAVASKKIVLAFLIKDPDSSPRSKTDKDDKSWEKLVQFRKKVEAKHTCAYWENKDQLAAGVTNSLIKAIKQKPQTGWISAKYALTPERLETFEAQRRQVEELKVALEKGRLEAPEDTQELAQGDDIKTIRVSGERNSEEFKENTKISWNELFKVIGPLMLDECSEDDLRARLRNRLLNDFNIKPNYRNNLSIDQDDFHQIKLQLRALKLIAKSEKKRAIKDTSTYWTLTPWGDTYLTQLLAEKRR